MELPLAETIMEACRISGVKVELRERYTTAWMRGRETAGIMIVDGDLAQLVTALIANAQLFVNGEVPKFSIDEKLSLSPFRLSLILY